MFSDPLVIKLVTFVRSIGLEVHACTIDWKTEREANESNHSVSGNADRADSERP